MTVENTARSTVLNSRGTRQKCFKSIEWVCLALVKESEILVICADENSIIILTNMSMIIAR